MSKFCPVEQLSSLLLTKKEPDEFDAIVNQPPIKVPSKNKMDIEDILVWKLYSKWKDPATRQWYHLHPESIIFKIVHSSTQEMYALFTFL